MTVSRRSKPRVPKAGNGPRSRRRRDAGREPLDTSRGSVSMGRSPTFPFAQWRAPDRYRTVYFDEGTGPALIFVHGLGGNVTHFEHLLPDLARDHRIVGLDLVGFGASAKPDRRYDVDFLVEHLLTFLAERGVERTTLVGHSMGGTICLAAALSRPEMVEALVLIGAACLAPLPRWIRLGSRLVLHAQVLNPVLKRSYDRILDNVFVDSPEANPYVRNFRVASLADEPGMPHLLPHLRDFARVSASVCRDLVQRDYSSRLHELKMPVLALWGDSDKLVTAPSVAEALTRIPRLRRAVIPRAGHLPMVERPAEVLDQIRAFLTNPP